MIDSTVIRYVCEIFLVNLNLEKSAKSGIRVKYNTCKNVN